MRVRAYLALGGVLLAGTALAEDGTHAGQFNKNPFIVARDFNPMAYSRFNRSDTHR